MAQNRQHRGTEEKTKGFVLVDDSEEVWIFGKEPKYVVAVLGLQLRIHGAMDICRVADSIF